MNHDVLKSVIFDQHEVIRNAEIIPRPYELDPQANYVLTGLRRCGKSTLLYQMARDLVSQGVEWPRIIYVNFEDERLAGFTSSDFNDIVAVQAELSPERGYYFLDEPQLVDGWERFARRLADAGERVRITGSNAQMLSSEIASTLGGRYIDRHVDPYSFGEYLSARSIAHDDAALRSTRSRAAIQNAFDDYLSMGGLPERLRYQLPREYIASVYQKVLLGDIVSRHQIRNPQALRLLMKKLAESVCSEISATRLKNMLREIGLRTSSDSVIEYLNHAEEAYLITHISNAYARFTEREGTPKYYFSDTGILGLHLVDKDTKLLENAIACALIRKHGEDVTFVRSARTGIDIDFLLPEARVACQVAWELSDSSYEREVGNLVSLSKTQELDRLIVVTAGEDGEIEQDGQHIEVISAPRFLLDVA